MYRLATIGPRKRAGLAVVVAVLIVAWFATRDGFTVLITAVVALAVLLLVVVAIEMQRWQASQRRRTDTALRDLDTQTTRADTAVHELGIVRSQLAAARAHADVQQRWRTTRTGASGPSTQQRTRLRVFPTSDVNAYQQLIYQEFPSWNFDVVRLTKAEELDAAESGDVIHYHWTTHVQQGCSTAAGACSASERFLDRLRTLQLRGVMIIWTVHEALPHECPFPEIELEFRQSLVDLADVVQVLHPATSDALDGAFTIPAHKTLVVPHPLYTGAQADHVTRTAARADLGYAGNDLLLLGLGSIRPYKRFERVIKMMPELQEQLGDRRLTFVIAGAAPNDAVIRDYVSALENEIAQLPEPASVRMVTATVPTNHLHILLRAADAAVAPYSDGLNSGVLLMSMTHGLPIVIASNPVTEDISEFGPVSTFDPNDDDALRRALIDRLTATNVAAVDPQFIETHSPAVISAAFARALRSRIDRRNAADPAVSVDAVVSEA